MKNEIMEMKVKDVLGMQIKFKRESTKRMNIGWVVGIYFNRFSIKDNNGNCYFKYFEDVEMEKPKNADNRL